MWICEQCGGKNIEMKAWIDANDNRVLDLCSSDGDPEEQWCRDCNEHVYFVEENSISIKEK